MPPKLDFYINYVSIVDEERRKIKPRLRDNAWILGTYDLCSEGFSGFELDEEYTCHDLVGRLEDIEKRKKQGEKNIVELQDWENTILANSTTIRKEDGTYKKYVNSWIYLTEHYLLTHKKDNSLGTALYENNKYDEMILACRSAEKSFYSFGGSFAHEWLTNGAKTIEDFRKDGSTQKLFGAGSPRKDQLERSLGIVKRLYNDMPGSYTYGVDTKGKADKVEGFLYKRVIGTWDVGSKTEHKVDNIDNTPAINGNVFQSAVITPDAVATFAGDRMAMILIEEVGFLGFVKTVRSAFRNSLEVGKRKIGKAKYLGTGGLAEEIREAKEMFESPDSFSIFPLPNYYDKNKGGNIGLFLSVVYQAEELKDENGNTVLEKALIDAIQKREREYDNADSSSFWEFIAYNPLYPKEMLRPSTKSVLPVAEMSEWRGMMQEMGIWKGKSSIGTFRFDAQEETKVAWKRDIEQVLNPIHTWGKDKELLNRDGCWVMYEDVMYPRPDNLYYILYDPAAQGGEGTSLHSILVYKHKFTGGDKSLQETFVAEFIGRKDNLEKNYEEVIKAALYYNAKILPETNVPGFVDWCERKQYAHLVMNEPRKVMTEVRRTPQMNYYRKGLRVDEHINRWSLNRYADWLNTPVLIDDDGTPMKRRFQNIYSLRLLDESINFVMDRKTEFDHMSSALLLMPLLLEIDEDVVEIVDEFEEFNKSKYSQHSLITNKVRQRSTILQY